MHPQINKLQKENEKIKRQLEVSKQREKLALTACARWELKSSMITSLFAKEMQHIRDDIDNARTLNELKSWMVTDVLDKWSDFLISANELDDMDDDSWDEKAERLASRANIKFNQLDIKKQQVEIFKEYGL